MLTSGPSAGKTEGKVRASKIRPGFKKPLRPIFELRQLIGGALFVLSKLRCGNRLILYCARPALRISYPKHVTRNSHPPRAVQRRAPRPQSRVVGRRELADFREVQQSQLARP